jgi:hypothetical protein
LAWIDGLYYGGGGGAGDDAGNGYTLGGIGGGANGSNATAKAPSGTVNTGGGGGGNGADNGAGLSPGGNGGSGVVIISMPTANYTGIYTGTPTITTSGSNTFIKFTSSGSYAV